MSRVDEINARGHANGWLAQRLAKDAERLGVTMKTLWLMRVRDDNAAFNVPARCTRVSKAFVFYEFSDGSTIQLPNQNGD